MILQTRPITTGMSFLPPGEGFWTFDPTHFPRPLSKWMQETYSMEYGSNHSRRTGCLIKTINFRFVHQFAFSQPGFNPPSDELERAAKAYWEKKLYEGETRLRCMSFYIIHLRCAQKLHFCLCFNMNGPYDTILTALFKLILMPILRTISLFQMTTVSLRTSFVQIVKFCSRNSA